MNLFIEKNNTTYNCSHTVLPQKRQWKHSGCWHNASSIAGPFSMVLNSVLMIMLKSMMSSSWQPYVNIAFFPCLPIYPTYSLKAEKRHQWASVAHRWIYLLGVLSTGWSFHMGSRMWSGTFSMAVWQHEQNGKKKNYINSSLRDAQLYTRLVYE